MNATAMARGPDGAALAPEATRRRSRIAAAVLAFLFGGVGTHRFYLGQRRIGAVYLLFCWTLVPGLWSIVDFVRLIAMTDDAFAARYGGLRGGGVVPAAIAAAFGVVASAALTAVAVPRLLALAEALAALPR